MVLGPEVLGPELLDGVPYDIVPQGLELNVSRPSTMDMYSWLKIFLGSELNIVDSKKYSSAIFTLSSSGLRLSQFQSLASNCE